MLVDLRPTVKIAGRTEEWVPRGTEAAARSLERKAREPAAAGEETIRRRSDTGEIDPEALLNGLYQEFDYLFAELEQRLDSFDAALDRLDRVEDRVVALETKAKANRGKEKPRPKAKAKARAATNGASGGGPKGRRSSTGSSRKRS